MASRELVCKVVVGTASIQLCATPDGRLVLVANQGTPKKPGTTVSIIDVTNLKVVSTIEKARAQTAWRRIGRRARHL